LSVLAEKWGFPDGRKAIYKGFKMQRNFASFAKLAEAQITKKV
jgi:hypothetical protein